MCVCGACHSCVCETCHSYTCEACCVRKKKPQKSPTISGYFLKRDIFAYAWRMSLMCVRDMSLLCVCERHVTHIRVGHAACEEDDFSLQSCGSWSLSAKKPLIIWLFCGKYTCSAWLLLVLVVMTSKSRVLHVYFPQKSPIISGSFAERDHEPHDWREKSWAIRIFSTKEPYN